MLVTNDAYFSAQELTNNIHWISATRLTWSTDAQSIDAGFADQNDVFVFRYFILTES